MASSCKRPRRIDLIGQRLDMLVVVKRLGADKYRSVQWLAECDCGGQRILTTHAFRHTLAYGHCGCMGKKMNRKSGPKSKPYEARK